MNVLVTGAGGFIGARLCAALAKDGLVPIALGQPSSLARQRVAEFIPVDGVPSREALLDVLRRYAPTRVYHLAGALQADEAEAFYAVNVFYGMRLLDACAALSAPPRIIVAGSAAEYGRPQNPLRGMSELDRPAPITAYGISKLAQTLHALARTDVPVSVARLFNPIGEGMPLSTAAGRFVDEIRRLEPVGGVVETGPLHALRDLADVQDVAQALVRMGDAEVECGLYNVCTGQAVAMSEVTNGLTALAPFPLHFRARSGNAGVDRAVGDPARLHRQGIVVPAPDLSAVLRRMLCHAGIVERV